MTGLEIRVEFDKYAGMIRALGNNLVEKRFIKRIHLPWPS